MARLGGEGEEVTVGVEGLQQLRDLGEVLSGYEQKIGGVE